MRGVGNNGNKDSLGENAGGNSRVGRGAGGGMIGN